MSEVLVAAAVRAALETPLGKWSAYDFDDVPEVLPNLYAVVSVSRRFGGNLRTGKPGVLGWRVIVLAVGRTVDESRWVADRVASLEGEQVPVAGFVSSPLLFETSRSPELDDGIYSGMSSWTFATWPDS